MVDGRSVMKLPLILMLFSFIVTSCDKPTPPAGFVELEIGGKDFVLELAADRESTFQGLSDREEISNDGGMMFVFRNVQTRAFVMRRCLVPIDIIFLDSGGHVVKMHEMQVEPYDTAEADLKSYSSKWPTGFAIELKGGTLKVLGINEGDLIAYDWRELKGMAR